MHWESLVGRTREGHDPHPGSLPTVAQGRDPFGVSTTYPTVLYALDYGSVLWVVYVRWRCVRRVFGRGPGLGLLDKGLGEDGEVLGA